MGIEPTTLSLGIYIVFKQINAMAPKPLLSSLNRIK
jgi:hypothetical protein